MNIAINTRLLLKDKLEGIGWYTYEIVKRLVCLYPTHNFFLIFDREPHPDFIFSKNVTPIVLAPKTRHPFLWYFWFEHKIPKILKQHKIDLLFSPDGYLSLKSDIKQISTIHDINFLHRPNDLPLLSRWYYNHFFPKFANKARKVVTVSQYSKIDLVNCFNIVDNKIKVIYNGVNNQFKPIDKNQQYAIRNKYTSGLDYFFYVGAIHPRKNVLGLLKAYDKFRQNSLFYHKLLIAGAEMFGSNAINNFYQKMKYKEDVIFLGRVSTELLVSLMASAQALVYIPFYEGFGIPVIEAMASGTPVICSNTTSLPEVTAGKALLVDPNNYSEVARAMKLIAEDQNIAQKLAEAGKLRAQAFSWDRAAQQIGEVIETELLK